MNVSGLAEAVAGSNGAISSSVGISGVEAIMSYAGDLKPTDAWKLLAEDKKAQLVDVRTRPEWMFVGVPDLSSLGKRATLQSWQNFPTMDVDANFAGSIAQQIPDHEAPILFLCRSGARSRAAATAMTQQGYRKCYNVAEGFEGNLDGERHRGKVGGWKAAGLPWAQE